MSDPAERLETAWEILAEGIEAAGADRERLFLAKLALLLARALDDPDALRAMVRDALRDLE
ncbi:hypothetical protein [Muricoccus radiodurans]|uniref:hypothetical protein n=1 Tax=Muricoccus radiodurans TaxID=2231721 RepID=UPI003CED84F2